MTAETMKEAGSFLFRWGSLAIAGLTFLLMLGPTGQSSAADSGSVDRSFGSMEGHTVTGSPPAFDPSTRFGTIETLPDDSTISVQAAGGRSILVKRRQDGSRVLRYGRRGSVLLPLVLRRDAGVVGIGILGKWTIVLSGSESEKDTKLLIQRRYNSTGAVDPGFGERGTATVSVRRFLPKYAEDGFDPIAPELDSRGRIYVGGSIGWSNSPGLIVRLSRNGKLDRSFGDLGAIVSKEGKCRSVDDLKVTSRGVYVLSQSCVRRYDLTGRPDLNFDFNPPSGQSRIKSIAAASNQAIYLNTASEAGGETGGILKVGIDGSIDPSYGDGGIGRPDFPGAYFSMTHVDSSGSVVFSGDSDSDIFDGIPGVARLNAGGHPETGFSDDGFMAFDPLLDWQSDYPEVAFLSDGLILTGMRNDFFNPTSQAMKILDDGSLDPSFGMDGIRDTTAVLPPVDQMYESLRTPGSGTIAAGRSDDKAALVKFNANGRLERNWGSGGWLRFRAAESRGEDVVKSLALSDEGKVLACLHTGDGIRIARITRSGELDDSFGDDGIVQPGGIRRCAGIAPAPGHKVMVGGVQGISTPVVLRLGADGTVDGSYGEEGFAIGERGISNSYFAFLGFEDGGSVISSFDVATRFDPNGDRDDDFDDGGVAEWPKPPGGRTSLVPVALAEDADGSLLLGGHNPNVLNELLVFKIYGDGKIDRSFGANGAKVIQVPVKKAGVTDLKVQAGGRVVVSYSGPSRCGWNGCLESARVTRLLASGRTDRSFGRKGTAIFRFGANSRANSLTVNKRGIIVAGFTETNGGRHEALLLRLKK